MEVLKRKSIIYECPGCHSILKVDPSDMILFRGKANVKCPCCNIYVWLYKFNIEETEVEYNNKIKMTFK